MINNLENKFIKYCIDKNLEANSNQIKVIKKLQYYFTNNFKSFFSSFF